MTKRTFGKRLVPVVREVWLLAGIALAMIVLLELALRAYFLVFDSGKIDARHKADCYDEAAWVKECFKEHVASAYVGWESYVYWRCRPFRGKHVNVNRDGLRHTVNPAKPTSDSGRPVRIHVFGGSSVWGTGVPDEHTICSLLSGLLRARGFSVEVTNFGQLGYVSTQELIALILQLRRGDVPDIVVFYDGFNDVWSGYQHLRPGLPLNETNRRKEFNLLNAAQTDLPKAVVFHHVLPGISRMMKTGLFKPKRVPKIRPKTWPADLPESIIKTYIHNLRVAEALGEEYGFKVMFYWQPAIFGKKWLTDYEKQEKETVRYLEPLFEATCGMMDDVAELRENVNFHNISAVFAEMKTPLFIDGVHLGERGNRMVAERMSENVAAVLSGVFGETASTSDR